MTHTDHHNLIAEPLISVGIHTDGAPDIERRNGAFLIRNMRIGCDFHWQQTIEALLPGEIEIPRSAPGDISLINRLPLETYLQCVVGSEMNPDAPVQFLMAHAIISRSWALRMIRHLSDLDNSGKQTGDGILLSWQDAADHSGFDVCNDDHCQRYQGLQHNDNCRLAVVATRGLVITDSEGEIADARFSKCCGGKTELFSTCWQERDYSYLPSIADPHCDLSDMQPAQRENFLRDSLKIYDATTDFNHWQFEISKKDIAANLKSRFSHDIGEIESLTPLQYGPSGRIKMLKVKGKKGELAIGKELNIRRLLHPEHLYSSAFTIEDHCDRFRLSGKGWGHGVGLCQIGAARMAIEGHSFEEILRFYYPHTNLTKIYE